MRHRQSLAAALLAFALQGCAGMSPQECVATDWHTLGYEHGVRGARADAIGRYREACARHGVTTDLAAYRDGREQGLREFCTAHHGFELGASGGSYGGVCPADLEAVFVPAFRDGHQLYTLESELYELDRALHAQRLELERVELELARASTALVSAETTDEQRVELVVELKNLAQYRQRLTAEIEQLERDRRASERRLNTYRNELAYRS